MEETKKEIQVASESEDNKKIDEEKESLQTENLKRNETTEEKQHDSKKSSVNEGK